jgi:trimeric autotransporter adhesin
MRSNILILFSVFVLSICSFPNLVYSQANCTSPYSITSSSICITGDLYNANSGQAGSCAGTTALTAYGVWYTFTATSTSASIGVGSFGGGSNLTAATTYIEVLSNGTCGSLTSVVCQTASSTLNATGLTVGNNYFIRVYVTTAPTGNSNKYGFTLTFQQTPSNDNCTNASTLTAGTTCTNVTGTLSGSTSSSPAVTSTCAGTPGGDVWYSFVAPASNATITLSNFGSSFSSRYIQLLSGSCGSLTSVSCANASSLSVATGLTPGNTYYVRTYSTTVAPTGCDWGFDICVTYVPPPSNDDCANSTLLYSNTSCTNTSATLAGATASSGIPIGCAAAGTYYDVWFSFVAASAVSETITLSSLSGIPNQRIQLYSGACGSLTSIACSSTSTLTASGLSVGTTYYVRVSNYNAAATSTGNFNICITHPAPTIPSIDYGKSYVNVSNSTGGGTIDPGDTLEVRATLVIRSSGLDSLVFLDTLHLGGGVRLVPGSIALRTNEGKVYKSFTDAVGDDEGYSYTSGTDTVIRINFGSGASSTRGGTLTNTSKPSVFGSTMIIMATYRVVVYAGYNTSLNLGGGKFITSSLASGTISNVPFSSRSAVVYSSPGLCPNSVAASNSIGGDNNGTFGSGSAQNRGASSNVTGYTYATFNNNAPGDYYYGIANNTSSSGNTTTTWPKPNSSHRVFNLWDITGDHTGATNTAKGNRPCDPNQPISATNPCGYMLVVNSAYKTDTAFQYTVTNLCPNTYYEISAWLKNICYKCGCDSNGVAATAASGYIPTATNDSSGVRPNLTFDINGIDYYTTGDILYGGLFPSTQTGSDSNNVWVKRGFTYLTGAAQTSFTLTIRNNAPGGGGNDWAMDDIALATCSPNLTFTPSATPIVCDGNSVDLTSTVTSYFNNYTHYKWQESSDNGVSWTDVSGTNSSGTGTPSLVSGQYQYTTAVYSTPVLNTGNNIRYRLITATTSSNLTTANCILADTLNVQPNILDDCPPVLGTSIISFNAKQDGSQTQLRWTTSKETETFKFIIEGSSDGQNFVAIGTMYSSGARDNSLNTYTWSESYRQGKYYYRIKMTSDYSGTKYSRVAVIDGLSKKVNLAAIVNPFTSQLTAYVEAPEAGIIKMQLIDNYGVLVHSQNASLQQGNNRIIISDTGKLPSGMYTLKLISNQNIISKKLIKQ